MNAEHPLSAKGCMASLSEPGALARSAYPRPDFRRNEWLSLNGAWQFAFGDGGAFTHEIIVPFAYQSPLSGITPPGGAAQPGAMPPPDSADSGERHSVVWYRREVELPRSFSGKRVFLCFGAVDYEARVYIDGMLVCAHTGGYTPFSVEVKKQRFTLTVRAEDKDDPAQPRGKQYWKDPTDRCWYTPCTGIWQSVWLECVGGAKIDDAAIIPDIDGCRADVEIELEDYKPGMSVEIDVSFEGRNIASVSANAPDKRFVTTINLAEPDYIDDLHLWWPHNPKLYDVSIKLLSDGIISDEVFTYFGMRKVSVEDGRFMLNNRPYYLKMILDQGYWRAGGMTAPSDDAYAEDIRLVKSFGFNGIRKHQKIEDPRFYYEADRLGIIVWGELPSAYRFGMFEISALSRDFQEFIRRDRSHPSVAAWVPLNESWGVRRIRDNAAQQSFARALYHLGKACDPTRPIISNDGWEQVETDIVTIHDYAFNGDRFAEKYTRLSQDLYPMSRRLFARGAETPAGAANCGTNPRAAASCVSASCGAEAPRCDSDAPRPAAMMTEYGGIALREQTRDGRWGYNMYADDMDELIKRFEDLTRAIAAIPSFCGFCYTQLTDVYQEVNGLLDFDHKPKLPPERVAEILSSL